MSNPSCSQELIKLAYEEKIVLMADEVYQENVYQDERPFMSAKKVMSEMGAPYNTGVELLSFHTVSKVRPQRDGGLFVCLFHCRRPLK